MSSEEPSFPLIGIVLVNYQGAADTLACIASLQDLQGVAAHVFVVDNASGDDSVTRIKREAPHVTLLECEENRGFSAGCNRGINAALAQGVAAIWLLNNDTTVESQSLIELYKASQRTGGVVGSLVLYPDGRYQRIGAKFSAWTGRVSGYAESDLKADMPVQSLTGASMLLPRQVVEQIGLWDESFFLYFEDNEYCLRLHQGKIPVTVCLTSKVFHKEGASTGKNPWPWCIITTAIVVESFG